MKGIERETENEGKEEQDNSDSDRMIYVATDGRSKNATRSKEEEDCTATSVQIFARTCLHFQLDCGPTGCTDSQG